MKSTATVDPRQAAGARTAAPAAAGPRVRSPATNRAVAGAAGIGLALALWEALPRLGVLPSEHIPPSSQIAVALAGLLATGAFWGDVLATMRGWLVGLLLSTVVAIPLGLLIGANAYLYRATKAIVEFLRPIPSVALIPLAILVYGITFNMKVFLVTFATFWPILIQSIYGVQDVDPVARDTARSFGLGRLAMFVTVTLPSASPYVATGLRLASSLALILAITAELVAGVPGLGRSILVAQSGGDSEAMYALIVATGLLGYGLSALFRRGERRVLRWHASHRGGGGA